MSMTMNGNDYDDGDEDVGNEHDYCDDGFGREERNWSEIYQIFFSFFFCDIQRYLSNKK